MMFPSRALIFASAIVRCWSNDSRELGSKSSKANNGPNVNDGAKSFKSMQSTKTSKSKTGFLDELASRSTSKSSKKYHHYIDFSMESQHPSAMPSLMALVPSFAPTAVPNSTPTAVPNSTPPATSTDIPSSPPTMVPTSPTSRRFQRTALPTTRTIQPVGIQLETLEPTVEPTKPSRFQWGTLEPTFEVTDPPISTDSEPAIHDDLPTTAPFVSPTFGPTEFETREPTVFVSPTFGPTVFETREPTLVASFGDSEFPTYPPIAAFIESDGVEIEVPPEKEVDIYAVEEISPKASKKPGRRMTHVKPKAETHRGRVVSAGKAGKDSKMSKAAKVQEKRQPELKKHGKNVEAKLGIGEIEEKQFRSEKIETNEDFEINFEVTDALKAKKRAKAFASNEGKRDLNVE
ncbi:hypothetical protein ACHAXS_012371 [Conticribra weissflogii]